MITAEEHDKIEDTSRVQGHKIPSYFEEITRSNYSNRNYSVTREISQHTCMSLFSRNLL
jgi:hypothetical protein